MHLHSRALIHFDMIRRCGSIREAARHLHLSSSALNRQLLELESEVGTPLFERMRTGLKLTPAGEVLSRHVLNVMQDAQRMASELESLRGTRRGTIDVVTVESLTADFMPRVIASMAASYPGVHMRVRIAGSVDAAGAVGQGLADVAVCFVRHRMEELRQVTVGRFALGAVVAPGHVLAEGTGPVSMADCVRHPLVLPAPELALRDELRSLMLPYQGHLDVVLETGSFELMRRLAMDGVGVAFANRFGIEKELEQGLLHHVPLAQAAPFHLGVYVRARRSLPTALAAFVQLASEEIARREALAG